jgi:hypothetical protein
MSPNVKKLLKLAFWIDSVWEMIELLKVAILDVKIQAKMVLVILSLSHHVDFLLRPEIRTQSLDNPSRKEHENTQIDKVQPSIQFSIIASFNLLINFSILCSTTIER